MLLVKEIYVNIRNTLKSEILVCKCGHTVEYKKNSLKTKINIDTFFKQLVTTGTPGNKYSFWLYDLIV